MTGFPWWGLSDWESELRFSPPRRWRFDYAWTQYKIAVEIEGGVWSGGRHNRGKGFLNDMEKYNRAAVLGWGVFRFTPSEFASTEALSFMRGVFSGELTGREIKTVDRGILRSGA